MKKKILHNILVKIFKTDIREITRKNKQIKWHGDELSLNLNT